MQKISTQLNKADLLTTNPNPVNENKMQPSDKTINKILQFAAAYKVQKLSKNQYIEMMLN